VAKLLYFIIPISYNRLSPIRLPCIGFSKGVYSETNVTTSRITAIGLSMIQTLFISIIISITTDRIIFLSRYLIVYDMKIISEIDKEFRYHRRMDSKAILGIDFALITTIPKCVYVGTF